MAIQLDPQYPNPCAARSPESFLKKVFNIYFEKLHNDHLTPLALCEKKWSQQMGSAKLSEEALLRESRTSV